MSVMDGVRIPIERSAALLKWEMVGEVLVPGVFKVGEIDKTNGCRQAEITVLIAVFCIALLVRVTHLRIKGMK